jgi:dTDP-4-dehydrorhamnose 3,5-epimerase
MIIHSLNINQDDRGQFYRILDALNLPPLQISISKNINTGTFRGFHYQLPPFEETKYIYCLAGSFMDIAIEIKTGEIHTYIASSCNPVLIEIPKGYAHGFITLEPNTELLYLIDEPHKVDYYRSFSHPDINGRYLNKETIMADKDRHAPLFEKAREEYAQFYNCDR